MAYPDRPENGIKAPPLPPRDGYITAYQIARKHGFTGTEEEWLASLVGGGGGSSGADGVDGVSPTVSVEAIDGGYRVTITDVNGEASFDLLNGTDGADGKDGTDGVGIERIERTSGDGSPGTTDIYTITLTDGSAETFSVYNGADGEGGTGGGADLLEEVEHDILSQQTVSMESDGAEPAVYSGSVTGGLGLVDGGDYIVEWGEDTYTLTAQLVSEVLNAYSLGNLALGEVGDDTGEDILIVSYSDQTTVFLTTKEGAEQTVRIYRMAEKLKEEYLPTDAIRMIVDEVIEEALGGDY